MIEAKVFLYLVSRERIIRLEKVIGFEAFPRLYEFLKIRNAKGLDHFAYQVVQVTHLEGDKPELWAHATSFTNGKSVVSFFGDDELDDYVQSYVDAGWKRCSSVSNKIFSEDGDSI